jgi:hypothetical protein
MHLRLDVLRVSFFFVGVFFLNTILFAEKRIYTNFVENSTNSYTECDSYRIRRSVINSTTMTSIVMRMEDRQKVLASLCILMDAYRCQEENGGVIVSMFTEGQVTPFHALAGARSDDTMMEQGRLGTRLLLDALQLTREERKVMRYPLDASLAGDTSLLDTDSETEDPVQNFDRRISVEIANAKKMRVK